MKLDPFGMHLVLLHLIIDWSYAYDQSTGIKLDLDPTLEYTVYMTHYSYDYS